MACDLPNGLHGAVIGNEKARLGWFRDGRCGPPDWPMKPLSAQYVTTPASCKSWQVEFFDPVTGRSTGKKRIGVQKKRLRIPLPEFQGSIAVRIKRLNP
jgi:hypothetical protein